MSESIDIMIVDDHVLFRAGLKMLLEKQSRLNVVCECDHIDVAMQYLNQFHISLVLMDISLPHTDGIKATRLIRQEHPSVKVIMLTMHNDEPYLVKALEAGASGYVLKEAAGTELISAIYTVFSGDMAIHPSMVKFLVNGTLKKNQEPEGGEARNQILTRREKEVLYYISMGYTNQEIAHILIVSVKTVEKHKANIMEKLNLTRRYQLVEYAFNHGIIIKK